MGLKGIFTSSFFLRSVFVASLIVLIFISLTTYRHTLDLSKSIDRLEHSHNVRIELERLLSFIKDAETGQRGFLVIHDSVFLQPFKGAKLKTDRSFFTLKKLMSDTKGNQLELDSLYALIKLRFELLQTTLILNEKLYSNKILLANTMMEDKVAMDKIRDQVARMVVLSMLDSQQKQNEYKNEISFTPFFTLSLILFSLFIFVLAYYRINRDIEALKQTNEKLVIQTESIKHAEEIGEFSTWHWDLEANKLEYSDNHYRLLGLEPQSLEPTIENFLQFVHPEDKHVITDGGNQVLKDNKYPSAFFRVIRKDGMIRYYKSLSKLLIDQNGKETLIGINTDVTDAHINSLALEEQNMELKQSNKDLASFNHIASHDLQEPLRKIQLFISRIEDKEKSGLSNISVDYFEKIQSATNRMRILIDDLLLFSRTNKAEKIFEQTDLNLLLENALQELAPTIEETAAKIESASLPSINVISFQIQQLFINLIGNSLKYRKADVAPLIKITYQKVYGSDFPFLNADPAKKYHVITLVDNGLGFEQQYAENIFNIFYRLHTQTEYAGTGIGLSICKKIVENHNGIIMALGRPSIGATFTVYLPE